MQPSPKTAIAADPLEPAPTARRPRRAVRVTAALLFAALLLPLLSGCLRVQASMGVSSNDRVSGRIVAAAVPQSEDDKGPQLKAPDPLTGKVRVESYSQDGYVGSQVYFEDLTFGEVQQLSALSDQTQGMFTLAFNRLGDLVTLTGRVDLGSLPPHGSDVQFTVAFPARVGTTNGTREGDSVVTWKLPAGDVSTLRAEVGYADPNTRSFAGWAGIVGGITLAVAAIVAVLAYMNRNPDAPEYVRAARWIRPGGGPRTPAE
ncbi:LppM family (lipo)protein [Nocardia otitidiscaviarum]|uniref:LppM family (lipo)protein n=1 Tax=Nocardia otitidiscaviarum TaxID=1823 RepID=UPI003F6A3F42